MKTKWKKIGTFGVDSGQFMICDPCYIDDEENRKLIEDATFSESIQTSGYANVKSPLGHTGLAVIGNTGIGDGEFTVYERTTVLGCREIKIRFR